MDYKFIISKIIRIKDLSCAEKTVLIFIIENLKNKEVVFTNNEASENLNISKGRISKLISSLADKNYISIYNKRIDDTTLCTERCIVITDKLLNLLTFFN